MPQSDPADRDPPQPTQDDLDRFTDDGNPNNPED
jgi:hypothetical protein